MKNICEKKQQRKNKDGFVALFTVLIIGFLALLLILTNTPRSWFQARNTEDVRSVAIARFAAISCVNIARLRVALREINIESEYFIQNSTNCRIERVHVQDNVISAQTSGTKNGIQVSLEAIFDSQNQALISIREL